MPECWVHLAEWLPGSGHSQFLRGQLRTPGYLLPHSPALNLLASVSTQSTMSRKDENHVHENVTLLQGPLNTQHSCFPIGIALHSE